MDAAGRGPYPSNWVVRFIRYAGQQQIATLRVETIPAAKPA